MRPSQTTRLLNYVVVGEIRSGTSLVQSTLCSRPGTVCHGDLFHENEEVRKEAHESYFGRSKNPKKMPEWFTTEANPWQYINRVVLDNPQKGECAVGFRMLYSVVLKWELWDLLETRCREGDFCVVHVVRNPVACLVSLRQAQKSGVWTRTCNSPRQTNCPSPVSLDAGELIAWCRDHASVQRKIRAACTDCLEVSYQEFFFNFQSTMRKVFDFLELPESDKLALPGVCRLRNRCIRDRISNWDTLRLEVPTDIRQLCDAEDLF